MEKIQRRLTFFVTILAGSVLFVVVATVFLQVVFRYVLARPLAWSVELARFLFTWTSMLGAAAAAEKMFVQAIDVFTRKLPERLQKPIDIMARAITFVTIIVLLVTGIELTGRVFRQTSSALGIRMSYVYTAVPVGLALMALLLLLDTYNTHCQRRQLNVSTSPSE